MRLGFPLFAYALALLLMATGAAACKPHEAPRRFGFFELTGRGAIIVRAQIVGRGSVEARNGAPNSYVDVRVIETIVGSLPRSSLRIWSNIGGIGSCPEPNHFAKVKIGVEGVFAVVDMTALNRRLSEPKFDYVARTYGIVLPRRGQVKLRGYRIDIECFWACAFYDIMGLEEFRAEVRRRYSQ